MLITVITVTFNSRLCIEKTIQSVLSQEDSTFEYIIIDGGSSDGTLDIIKSYSAGNSRIRWISEPDRGISDAFNKGLRLSTGELVGIINADDEYLPGTLQAVEQEYLACPGDDVFHGDMLRMDGEKPLFILKPLSVDSHIWRQMPINHPATFVTKRAYGKVGMFDINLRIAMDFDLMLRLYRAGCRFRYIDRTLAIMRYGGASDDRFLDGLREFRDITVRQGYPRWKAEVWLFWKAIKGYVKVTLRKSGFQRLMELHPRFRKYDVRASAESRDSVAHSSVKNRRVLFLVDKSGFGGVQTIAYSLIERGVSPDIEMFFFFLRNINDRFKMEDIAKPNVCYAKATRRYSLLPFFDILGLIRRQKVGILHLNGNKSVIFGVLLKILFFPRLRLVAHDHGGVFDNTSWYPMFLKLSRRWIDLFVTVSNYRKKFLVSRSDIDPERICVLNNFVDPARLGLSCGQKADPRDHADGSYVIGYVGGLSRIKGCDVLIRAFALVKETIPNARLVIAGDGPACGELELLAESLNAKEQISFLGFVDKPGATYAGFDLMVIPSRSEEGPICLYEAWLMGLPVVASNAHVLDERIKEGETGMFFESEDFEDLAQKILLAYRNKDLAARIRDGGSREVVHHSVEQYLKSLQDLYVSL